MVFVEVPLTTSLRMAEAEAATALLSNNENKTMMEIDVPSMYLIVEKLNLPRQNHRKLEHNGKKIHFMSSQSPCID